MTKIFNSYYQYCSLTGRALSYQSRSSPIQPTGTLLLMPPFQYLVFLPQLLGVFFLHLQYTPPLSGIFGIVELLFKK